MVVTQDKKNPRVAVMRTSDTITFKGCRRRWDLSSHLRQDLGTIQTGNPLWMGSGVHYALEDFHGYNVYGSPSKAFQAFVLAYNKTYPDKIPDDWQELSQLACGMMDYYELWLENRPKLQVYRIDGVPQLEVAIKIPIDMKQLKAYNRIKEHWDEVFYSLTLDGVVIDESGQLWVMEYKTAKIMQTQHFATDPQCTRYVWAANCVYGKDIAGIIYQQHKKKLPSPARMLVNGTISIAQNQDTTRIIYKKACLDKYGSWEKMPGDNKKFINQLAQQENDEADSFVRRDKVFRNAKSSMNAAEQVLLEISDMLDPELSIYPNPTRECPNYCPFLSPCVAMDDGSDYKGLLEGMYEPRPEEYDLWRKDLPTPETFKGIKL